MNTHFRSVSVDASREELLKLLDLGFHVIPRVDNVYSQVGTKTELAKALIQEEICSIDISTIQDQRVIIKGCADIEDPAFAMSYLVRFLQPLVKTIMYGEPCSTVPIFKK
jgi:hypothetical protein